MELPKRKINRLTDYDYSTPNAYFITICTDKRKNLFWNNVGATIGRPQDVQLSKYGQIVSKAVEDIPIHYPAVTVDHYVVMPNHIHMLLQIHSDGDGRPMAAPTIATVVNQMKGTVSKRVGFSVWQKGFYDHIIRGDADYREVWEYIENNPVKRAEDKLLQDILSDENAYSCT